MDRWTEEQNIYRCIEQWAHTDAYRTMQKKRKSRAASTTLMTQHCAGWIHKRGSEKQRTYWEEVVPQLSEIIKNKNTDIRQVTAAEAALTVATPVHSHRKKYGSRRWIKYIFICIAVAAYIYLRNALVERQSAQSLANLFSLCSRRVHRIFGQRKKELINKNEFFGGVMLFPACFFSTIRARFLLIAFFSRTTFRPRSPVFLWKERTAKIYSLSAEIRLCVHVLYGWLCVQKLNERMIHVYLFIA